jgi:hypothetical protein
VAPRVALGLAVVGFVAVIATLFDGFKDAKKEQTGFQDRETVDFQKCVQLGLKYYMDIGSYPRLGDGMLAEHVVRNKCVRSVNQAFGATP